MPSLAGGMERPGEGTQTAATTAATSGGWVDAATMQAWDHDEAVLGIWECSVMRGGSPAQMTFTFETDGTVRLEEQYQDEPSDTWGHGPLVR